MTLAHAALLFIAAIIAGAINSVAGGGSFISFPALLLAGLPPIPANATNTVAVWPGSLASLGAYRQELSARRNILLPLAITSLLGGAVGAELLLHTPEHAFTRLIPWLLLCATLLFAFGGTLITPLRAKMRKTQTPGWLSVVGTSMLQLGIAVYGGYFGAGIGILMLATLALMGEEDIHEMNALKALLATLINGVAVVAFIAAKAVYWPQACLMVVGAITGGYGGASLARRSNPALVRSFVIFIGFSMTIYFFTK